MTGALAAIGLGKFPRKFFGLAPRRSPSLKLGPSRFLRWASSISNHFLVQLYEDLATRTSSTLEEHCQVLQRARPPRRLHEVALLLDHAMRQTAPPGGGLTHSCSVLSGFRVRRTASRHAADFSRLAHRLHVPTALTVLYVPVPPVGRAAAVDLQGTWCTNEPSTTRRGGEPQYLWPSRTSQPTCLAQLGHRGGCAISTGQLAGPARRGLRAQQPSSTARRLRRESCLCARR